MQYLPQSLSKNSILEVVDQRRNIKFYNETTMIRARIYFTFNDFEDRRNDPKCWWVPLETLWMTESVHEIEKELWALGWRTYFPSGDKEKLYIFSNKKTYNKFIEEY